MVPDAVVSRPVSQGRGRRASNGTGVLWGTLRVRGLGGRRGFLLPCAVPWAWVGSSWPGRCCALSDLEASRQFSNSKQTLLPLLIILARPSSRSCSVCTGVNHAHPTQPSSGTRLQLWAGLRQAGRLLCTEFAEAAAQPCRLVPLLLPSHTCKIPTRPTWCRVRRPLRLFCLQVLGYRFQKMNTSRWELIHKSHEPASVTSFPVSPGPSLLAKSSVWLAVYLLLLVWDNWQVIWFLGLRKDVVSLESPSGISPQGQK